MTQTPNFIALNKISKTADAKRVIRLRRRVPRRRQSAPDLMSGRDLASGGQVESLTHAHPYLELNRHRCRRWGCRAAGPIFRKIFGELLVAVIVIASTLSWGATANFTFGKKTASAGIGDFGLLSLVVQDILQDSYGNALDPATRKKMGDIFSAEIRRLDLYSKFLANEMALFRDRKKRVKTRYELCQKVLRALVRKSHNEPELKSLLALLYDVHQEKKNR